MNCIIILFTNQQSRRMRRHIFNLETARMRPEIFAAPKICNRSFFRQLERNRLRRVHPVEKTDEPRVFFNHRADAQRIVLEIGGNACRRQKFFEHCQTFRRNFRQIIARQDHSARGKNHGRVKLKFFRRHFARQAHGVGVVPPQTPVLPVAA